MEYGADISFVNLGITIDHLRRRFTVFGFRIAFYAIIIVAGMAAGIWVCLLYTSQEEYQPEDQEIYDDYQEDYQE